MLTVFIPDGESGHFEVQGIVNNKPAKTIYKEQIFNGRRVIDLPRKLFLNLIAGPQGLKWERENPEALSWLGTIGHQLEVDAFPGENRPPPITTPAVEAAPVRLRVIAPAGITGFSNDGVEFDVPENGIVEVDKRVADALHPHGFRIVREDFQNQNQ